MTLRGQGLRPFLVRSPANSPRCASQYPTATPAKLKSKSTLQFFKNYQYKHFPVVRAVNKETGSAYCLWDDEVGRWQGLARGVNPRCGLALQRRRLQRVQVACR